MRKILIHAALVVLVASGCESGDQATASLSEIIDAEWEWSLENFPTYATFLGDTRFNDRFTDLSLDAIEARHRHTAEVLQSLDEIDADALEPNDRLNHDLFRQQAEMDLAGYAFRTELMPMNQMGGPQLNLPSLQMVTPFKSATDYENYLARLSLIPEVIDQNIALMREGISSGWIFPKVPLRSVPDQLKSQIDVAGEESPFFAPFLELPENFTQDGQNTLKQRALELITEQIQPSYTALHDFIVNEYLPAARDDVGAWSLPDGEAYYAYRVRRMTTTDLTPEEIHDIGLDEVARIKAEMMRIVEETGFGQDFAAFTDFLRTDPQFYHDTPEALLSDYRDISKRLDAELPRLFGRLPRTPYGVQAIPDYEAPASTTAYYRPPSADGSRGGTFFANTYALEQRPTYEMEALTIHEAVPGHHLQIAIAQELEDVPNFRKFGGYTAFVEGWGLYSESLGEELGFYTNPYSKFGQLSYEMWRAVRLVVDTGMHQKRWTRQQAIDYFHENTGLSDLNIISEVDRYIVWPGQALAYKIGELKIKELRAAAEETLGDDFDIRGFHDTVLGQGALPLDLLQARVESWVEDMRE